MKEIIFENGIVEGEIRYKLFIQYLNWNKKDVFNLEYIQGLLYKFEREFNFLISFNCWVIFRTGRSRIIGSSRDAFLTFEILHNTGTNSHYVMSKHTKDHCEVQRALCILIEEQAQYVFVIIIILRYYQKIPTFVINFTVNYTFLNFFLNLNDVSKGNYSSKLVKTYITIYFIHFVSFQFLVEMYRNVSIICPVT